MGSRYWTERARGLYFQVLVNNLDLAARAMTDDRALAEWKMARARALEALPSAGDGALLGGIDQVLGDDAMVLASQPMAFNFEATLVAHHDSVAVA